MPFAQRVQGSIHESLESRLAAYVAAAAVAAAIGATTASDAQADIVANTTEQAFGINGDVNIDFNSDGQIDFQIDHDRVDLGGGNQVDYLQIDKNDATSATNPLAIPGIFETFPPNGTTPNDSFIPAYVTNTTQAGSYPAALTFGSLIGSSSPFSFEENSSFQGTGRTIRANRLLDEDATQVDQVLGGLTPSQVQVPFDGPNFLGLAGGVRYVGVKFELNGSDVLNYGWIGVRIDNELDATGAVVGYGYETNANTPIAAGVPEPGAALLAGSGLLAAIMKRRRRC